jgi:hypothetical protein
MPLAGQGHGTHVVGRRNRGGGRRGAARGPGGPGGGFWPRGSGRCWWSGGGTDVLQRSGGGRAARGGPSGFLLPCWVDQGQGLWTGF